MRLQKHGGSCGNSCCLRVENLSVHIGGEAILENVNLHLHCGEMAAIIGPNGAGKSTFLKAILGQREYEGVIAFSEPGQRSKKPRIGYVPQSPAFDPSDPVSVSDLFACCMAKRPAFFGLSRAMKQTVLECLERVHGESLIDKRVGTLSGGELQRVLLAFALDPMPDLLLLDEPVSAVDRRGIELFYDLVTHMRREHAMPIILVSHDLSHVMKYANRAALIDHTVVVSGPVAEVMRTDQVQEAFGLKLAKEADEQ